MTSERPALRGPLAVALVALAGVAVGVAIGAIVTVAFRRANEPYAVSNGTAAPPRPTATSEPAPPSPAARPAKPPPQKEARAPIPVPTPRPARLAIELQHSLEKGTLRLWVDDDLSVETRLEAEPTKKLLVLKGRKGSVAQTLEVSPGEHEIRVEVAWDDNLKTKRLAGTFKPGATRRMTAKVGGLLKKNLSLEWQ